MQITRAESSTIDIRLTESLATGAGGIGDRGGLAIQLHTDADLIGLGETAPIPGIEGPGLEAIAVEIDGWNSTITGSTVDDALQALDAGSLSPLSRFAIHTALVDLQSQAAGAPAAQWLRAGSPAVVQVNGLVAETNPGAVHARITELVAQGMRAIKLKVGAVENAQDVTRIIAASEAAGPNVALRLDANRSWSPEIAERVIGRVGMHRIDYLEDPTMDETTYARIQEATGVSVALDVPVTHDPAGAVRAAGVSIAVLKPAAVGGIDRILDLARAMPELRIVVSSSIDREVALAAAVHAAAALPTGGESHGLSTGALVRGVPEALVVTGGEIHVPLGPGVWRSDLG
jgi:o-succinylbenzoate synthase